MVVGVSEILGTNSAEKPSVVKNKEEGEPKDNNFSQKDEG